MKRYGNIYEKIYDYNNLELAHKNARKNKTFYTEVKEIDENPEEYLIQLQIKGRNTELFKSGIRTRVKS